eukprot:9830144-Alexandrium_andersonii.AAC.1
MESSMSISDRHLQQHKVRQGRIGESRRQTEFDKADSAKVGCHRVRQGRIGESLRPHPNPNTYTI